MIAISRERSGSTNVRLLQAKHVRPFVYTFLLDEKIATTLVHIKVVVVIEGTVKPFRPYNTATTSYNPHVDLKLSRYHDPIRSFPSCTMTILALDSAVVSSELNKMIASKGPISPQSVPQGWSIPRINLRKRPCSSKMTNLESVNSAFLSGLFADVAMATQVSSSDAGDSSLQPSKKSRINKTKSMPRCERSFAVLMKALNQASNEDPNHESLTNFNTATILDATDQLFGRRDNSLQFQLDCVSSSSSTDVSSATSIAFPYLPATVSNSSYSNNPSSPTSTLTHVISDLQSSVTEKIIPTSTETYGWFVEMEDEVSSTSQAPTLDRFFPPKDLAFSAHVAPKADNYDAELEWATAADTVDDVLGCFF